MSEYTPDLWQIISITSPENETHYRVFACWYGGWAGSDSWKMNSGITSVQENEHYYLFSGTSGSVYNCAKAENCYRASGYGSGVLANYMAKLEEAGGKIEVLPQETDWLAFDWGCKE